MNMCPNSLIDKEMQVKTKPGCHFSAFRFARIKNMSKLWGTGSLI